jgi:hypothetical protein
MVERARLKARRVPRDPQDRLDLKDPQDRLDLKDPQDRLDPKDPQDRLDPKDPQDRMGQLAHKEPQDQPQLCCP